MAGETHKTAVVIIPPARAWPPIQTIRKEHDRQFRRWMPHITLIYPFRPVREFDALGEQFQRVCAGLRPFELELATFNFFDHSRRTCTTWLTPEPTKLVIELQTRLCQVVPDCNGVRQFPGGFTPHLSIGQARGRDRAIGLITKWQSTWKPLRFVVSEISLIWRNDPPDDVFRLGRRIELGGRGFEPSQRA